VDPLDAFMADINAEVREDKPTSAKPDAGLALDDDDNVADFLEVCRAALHDGTNEITDRTRELIDE
jgi:hypothetical protein